MILKNLGNVLGLGKYRPTQTKLLRKQVDTPYIQGRAGEVYSALIKGISEMRRRGVDCIVLALYEAKPDENVRGIWITAGRDTNYYPFEMLSEPEQKMISGRKHYSRIALVLDDVGGVVTYPGEGVEKVHRTRISPFLPYLKPESELNYVTKAGVWTKEKLRDFALDTARNGWTKETVEKAIVDGVQEYHTITKRLIEQAGVDESIARIGQRAYSPFEQLLLDMHKQMRQAKK